MSSESQPAQPTSLRETRSARPGLRRPRPSSALLTGWCVLAASLALVGCREAATALGGSTAEARANADTLFLSLGARFGPVEPVPGYTEGRAKFARSALVPSRIFDDPDLWTWKGDESRHFEIMGRPAEPRYRLGIRNGVTPPRRPGEYRRTTRLERLSDADYEWTVRDELAIGSITPDDLGRSLSHLLRAAEGSTSHAVRTGSRVALPGTSAVLGRLFSLDSLVIQPGPGDGTYVSFVASMDAARMAGDYPNLSRYLERYAGPLRAEIEVFDASGALWWTVSKAGDRLRLRLRVRDGALAPLVGAPGPMPDRLRVRADVATRIRIFGIRIADLEGDVTLIRRPAEKAFTVRFRDEPEWHLPPLAARLIRGPLRRPFEGDGATLTFAARAAGGRTLLVRDYRIAVRESAILRWFGGLGNTLVGDFRQGAEQEYDRFVGELFAALRADSRMLIH